MKNAEPEAIWFGTNPLSRRIGERACELVPSLSVNDSAGSQTEKLTRGSHHVCASPLQARVGVWAGIKHGTQTIAS